MSEQPQQEWTLALAMIPDRETRKAVDKAHNAALAAERKERKQAEARDDELIQRYKESLLAAQAAIAEVEAHNIAGTISPEALEKHDDEVRKPLVDALKDAACRLRELTRSYEERWGKDHTRGFHELIQRIDALAVIDDALEGK